MQNFRSNFDKELLVELISTRSGRSDKLQRSSQLLSLLRSLYSPWGEVGLRLSVVVGPSPRWGSVQLEPRISQLQSRPDCGSQEDELWEVFSKIKIG